VESWFRKTKQQKEKLDIGGGDVGCPWNEGQLLPLTGNLSIAFLDRRGKAVIGETEKSPGWREGKKHTEGGRGGMPIPKGGAKVEAPTIFDAGKKTETSGLKREHGEGTNCSFV